MSLTLHGEKNNLLWRILIAAKYSGVHVNVPEFDSSNLSKSLVAKAPILETSEGVLFEANAIARYVARLGKNNLFGENVFEAAQVEQWIDFAVHEIELPANVWVFPIQGKIPNNPTATSRAKADIKKVLETLNKHLLTNTYLVGHRITLADIVVAMTLYHLYELVLEPNFRKPFVNTNRWFNTLINQTQFKSVLGEVKLCDKASEPSAAAPKAQKEKGGKKEKKQQQQQQQPKKEVKKEKEEAPKSEEKESKPKGKNPLDLLPAPKMILDDWKRTYSNEDTITKAIPWFWEQFDPKEYSIWFCSYKYNEENEKLFMTCNLVGGFIQRLDKLRKYGFGVMLIFGNEAPFEISGVWVFRGEDIPAEMKECDDCEHYVWRRANVSDAKDKQLINDYLAWEGKFEGLEGKHKTPNQGKIFK